MYKAYKYRIYPTDAQKVLLDKHFGCTRFIYNLALETKIEAWKKGINLTCYDLQKQMTDLKKDCTWLNEVSRYALDRSIANLDDAYKYFFKGAGFPAFKKKSSSASYSVRKQMSIKGDLLCIPKMQDGIKIIIHRDLVGEPINTTISKRPTGKYFASIMVRTESVLPPVNNNSVGIDLGIKTFAVTSDGKEYASSKFLRKSLDRLRVLQRRASRKKKGSANRRKANLRVAICYERSHIAVLKSGNIDLINATQEKLEKELSKLKNK